MFFFFLKNSHMSFQVEDSELYKLRLPCYCDLLNLLAAQCGAILLFATAENPQVTSAEIFS